MKILVTGASGFVGTATTVHLETLGHEVIQLIGPSRAAGPASFPVDLADESTFPDPRSFSPIDAVVHCAGIAHRFGPAAQKDFERVNVRGVENTLRFAVQAGAKHFVLISSVLVYGTPPNAEPITEDYPTTPDDDYGRSKLEGERVAIKMCGDASIRLSILRPAPIIGEGSRGNIARLIRAIDRRRFVWVGDGRNKRSFVYVGDVARAIGAVLDRSNQELSIFNLAGQSMTVAELVALIEEKLERRTPRLRIPGATVRAIDRIAAVVKQIPSVERVRRTLATWMADAVYSGENIERNLGFVPETTIREAIGREIDHYLASK